MCAIFIGHGVGDTGNTARVDGKIYGAGLGNCDAAIELFIRIFHETQRLPFFSLCHRYLCQYENTFVRSTDAFERHNSYLRRSHRISGTNVTARQGRNTHSGQISHKSDLVKLVQHIPDFLFSVRFRQQITIINCGTIEEGTYK